MLNLIGVPRKEFDAYTLKRMERGKQAENWIIQVATELGVAERTQTELKYVTPAGFTIYGIEDVKFKGEDISTEIKSIKNSAFKYIDKDGARLGHKLQAVVYALAGGLSQARVLYVAADDLRTKQFIFNAQAWQSTIDDIAYETYEPLKSGLLPVFKSRSEFHDMGKYRDYASYPDWFGRYENQEITREYTDKNGRKFKKKYIETMLVEPYTQEYLMNKLETEFPVQFKKLKEGL